MLSSRIMPPRCQTGPDGGPPSGALPGRDRPRDDREQRVHVGDGRVRPPFEPGGAARGQLGAQVTPLQVALARGGRDRCETGGRDAHRAVGGGARPVDPGVVEAIAARRGLGLEAGEERADRAGRVRVLPEPQQLRVVPIPCLLYTSDAADE